MTLRLLALGEVSNYIMCAIICHVCNRMSAYYYCIIMRYRSYEMTDLCLQAQ